MIKVDSTIVNKLKSIGMITMQCATIYLNIYEYVSYNMKIHRDGFEQSKDNLRTKQDS